MKTKTVMLVGAGCGDPEFLTLKAQRHLAECEVLIYDSLVAEKIVRMAPAACETIYVGKRYGRHAMKQEEINALLVQKAREGKKVVRLKGGDPYVFGRGGEEFLALREAGISCEVVPGITSAIAVPAAAGIPVTHRGKSRSFTVITGTTVGSDGQEGLQMDFETLARLEGTLVILMGVHHLKEIAAGLLAAGKDPDTPCAVIMEGTTVSQRTLRASLSCVAEQAEKADMKSPAIIVIGGVAQLELLAPAVFEEAVAQDFPEEAFAAAGAVSDKLPLSGLCIGVTGTPHFAAKLADAVRAHGGKAVDFGFMQVRPTPKALPDLAPYGWLVFTSPNGVRIFLDKCRQEKRDLRSLFGKKIAVIGPGTAQVLEEAGLYADYMPTVYDARHLAQGLTEYLLQEEKTPALFLRAAQGSPALPEIFSQNQLPFTEFALYEMGVDEEKRRSIFAEPADYVVFGSASGVRAYFEGPALGKAFAGKYVCIGEACAAQLRQYTKREFLTAAGSSIEGIIACLCAHSADSGDS